MSRVVTVTGHVDAADLDFTLVHEHVVAASPGVLTSWPELHGGRTAVAQRGTQALSAARASGVRTIVDCTTFDLGRDALLLADVSRSNHVGRPELSELLSAAAWARYGLVSRS
jgi:phosphotriesterase-related protein